MSMLEDLEAMFPELTDEDLVFLTNKQTDSMVYLPYSEEDTINVKEKS